jgi:hypothetical protein
MSSPLSSVHDFYDFVRFRMVRSPLCLDLLAAAADLRAARLDSEIPHPDLALLPIRPMH